ncbi:uncharacterized protein LOC141631499 [Silene latifolia]|uniref:uncharacterized protein LOC141631499 n=1 Tax=Silene latifolia TaxID=37657 RepID=UPI003D779860
MEYLSRILEFATQKWEFRYHPLCKGIRLNHMLFADDLLLFCKGDTTSIILMVRAFSIFSATSGLKINVAKSEVIFAGVSDAVKQDILQISKIVVVCRTYLWDRGTEYQRAPLVAWDKVCCSKKTGGLGVKNTELWNIATIDHIYVKGADWATYVLPADSNWNWRNICKVTVRMDAGYVNNSWMPDPKGYSVGSGY